MAKLKDLTNQQFGNWLVLERVGNTPNNASVWKCKCLSCNSIHEVVGQSLTNGKSKMCRKCSAKIYNHSEWRNNPIVHIFSGMWQRCYDKNSKGYKDYGCMGIAICDEWLNDRTKFYEWAYQNGYKKGLSIERIDNSKNYEPSNCKFIPKNEQARNRRMNVKITLNGQTKYLFEWLEEYGIKRSSAKSLKRRYNLNWEQALLLSIEKKEKKIWNS